LFLDDHYTVLDGIEGLSHVRYASDIIIIYFYSMLVICWRYMASDHKHGNSWNQPIADKK